ncbi:hypothetical protein Ccrd_020222 [Cynara cardunculus var. scolymus]|uniref:Uncharacterized protein n=1 Tax=Cynara cardunculus var. scolymus TaxID=59895 RepID=A0A124SEX6_CYNCS|nr:hypothetical protein Ccrd_020222 [Cynara cardunculus var. scolymus]
MLFSSSPVLSRSADSNLAAVFLFTLLTKPAHCCFDVLLVSNNKLTGAQSEAVKQSGFKSDSNSFFGVSQQPILCYRFKQTAAAQQIAKQHSEQIASLNSSIHQINTADWTAGFKTELAAPQKVTEVQIYSSLSSYLGLVAAFQLLRKPDLKLL